jgi:heptose-I-phosphate ethanolaminephosphotransferase
MSISVRPSSVRGATAHGQDAIRWLWRFRWVVLLNAFLLSPIACYELRLDQGGPDRTLLFILPASLLWLTALQLLIPRPLVVHALLLPFYLVVAADLYLIFGYGTRLSSSMLLVIVDNWSDALEYVQAHAAPLFASLLGLLSGYGYALYRIRHLRLRISRAYGLVALAAVDVLYIAVERQVGTPVHLAANDRSSPFGVLPQSYTAHLVHRESKSDAERARAFRFHARRARPPSEPEAYVLVIGESSRPDHWGLYGYQRDTTPRLDRESNLIAFRDVVSQCALTKVAVPLLLTRGSIDDPARAARERSAVSAFEEAGFSTYWISTQQRDPFTGTINRYSSEAEVERYFERRHDQAVLEPVAEILADPGQRRVFVVIHTMGSHYVYDSRYPAAFAAFRSEGRELSERQRLVNGYDNTVRYGDFVLSGVIESLRRRAGIKALLYVSDHGENLQDDERRLFGHFLNNAYDLPIPMFVWYSDEFAATYPHKVAALRANATRRLSTRSVFYSLLQMADITLPDPALDGFGVFGDGLRHYPRLVCGKPKPFDYDASGVAAERQPASVFRTRPAAPAL